MPGARRARPSATPRATQEDRGRVETPAKESAQLDQLLAHLDRLDLRELQQTVGAHLAWAHAEHKDGLALLERVFGEAAGRRRERVVERRIKESGLRTRKTLEAFEWAFQPKLDRALILDLGRLSFVERGENVIITGKTGTGKSHILQALALRACEHEIPVRYTRCVDLLDDLHAGLADGSYERRLRYWSRHALLVVDDVGLGQVRKRDDEPTAAHSLYNLVDRRHEECRSTALTSNIALGDWGRYLGDTALTASILDRVAMNAVRIDIDGPSYRQHVARERAKHQTSKDRKP